MHTFPVSSSVLSAAHLGGFVRAQYGLQNAVCRLLRAGMNHTYLVTNNDERYVLRIYSLGWRTRLQIAEELRLVNMLADNGINVSHAIPGGNGDGIYSINAPEGERPVVLFSYAPGEKLHNYPAELHYRAGVFMARMHLLTQNYTLQRVSYTPQVLLVDSLEELRPFISFSAAEITWMQETQALLLQVLCNPDKQQLRSGAVHMDMWFDNLNILGNDITLFDFDFCGNGWLCTDVAYYILQLQTVEPVLSEFDAKKDAFLGGYQSVTPLTAEEKRLLPALGTAMYYFYLGVQCRRFEDYGNMFISEAYIKRYIIARIRRWFDFCDTHTIA